LKNKGKKIPGAAIAEETFKKIFTVDWFFTVDWLFTADWLYNCGGIKNNLK
jgi:hypothetical protein